MHTPEWLSEPAEVLLEKWAKAPNQDPYDVVIVGSGYGASVAAARLAACQTNDGQRLHVCVLERGREHVAGTFPDNVSELPGHVRFSRFDDPVAGGMRDGLFDVRIGKDVGALVANGLGGGSLINAGVAEKPAADVFAEGWPQAIRDDSTNGQLDGYYDRARRKLGANAAQAEDLAKHVRFFASTKDLQPRDATITVAYETGPNEHGVREVACANCGDCATGCNVGAKKTLSTNYLADAWQHCAEIYTGVTVSHVVKHGDYDWEVVIALTVPTRPLERHPRRSIRAKHVILAAGTFGSTEILLRSRELERLPLSERLGARFSTNGDMISALYKRGSRVNASAREFDERDERCVGPTITGIATSGATRGDRIVIEELAVPGALRRVFEEIVTTSAMFDRLGRFDCSTHRPFTERDPNAHGDVKRRRTDPAAVDPAVIRGCQLFASMGDDGAKGRLQLVPDWNVNGNADRIHNGAIRVHWPDAGKATVFARQDEAFRKMATDGWIYLPSPLWQPLPTSLSEALSGAKPAGLLFSVHPLGGCAMADDVAAGVVDHIGRVFDATPGSDVHRGLLVLDGSIIPTALGINPLLTITAVAERAIDRYIATQPWGPVNHNGRTLGETPILERSLPREPTTEFQFSERMAGQLRLPGDAGPRTAELMINFAPVDDLAKFVQNPRHPLKFRGTLSFPQEPGDENAPRTEVDGSVELLVRGARSPWKRILKALGTFFTRRFFADTFGGRNTFKPTKLWSTVKGMLAVASNAGEVRYMFYDFELASNVLTLPAGTKFTGRKTFEYVKGKNLWRQLVDLDLDACIPPSKQPIKAGRLTADLAFPLQGFASPLQVVHMRDLPAAWIDFISLGLFLTRIILKIHFWSFRLPKYQTFDPMRDVRRLAGALEPLHMERHVIGPEAQLDADVFLLLTRYRCDTDKPGRPVLLIHGLGASGNQFATERLNPNLVQHLARGGFDVWVAELRTSIALPSSVHQWTLDQVARGDIPRLVDFVLNATGEQQIDVVAHCIGSAMFCTAVLAGHLTYPSGESKIRRAALLQVGPLITLSKGTKLRALALAPLSRVMPDGFVDFSVDDRADWVQSTIDRLLNTYPYPDDEARHHRLGLFDNPHIANCNRWTAIDGLMIAHENLSEEMLENLGEILGHSNTTTWAQPIQSGLLERLTDSEGTNVYVTNEHIRDHFHFPVQFLHGSKNDVFLPLTSFKSCELIKRVHGEDFPASVEILDGYRHLDPLIGRNAATDVFPRIEKFLTADIAVPPRRVEAPNSYYFRRPLIGPLVGWLRHEAGNTWQVRVWCRLDDQRSPVSYAVVQVQKEDADPQPVHVSDPAQPRDDGTVDVLLRGPLDTLLCVDVTLDDAPGTYRISVLSAHEAVEPVSAGYQEAEQRAGKRKSESEPHIKLAPGETLRDRLLEPGTFERCLALTHRRVRHGDDKIDHARVHVPASPTSDDLTFAVASCRYPGWLVDRQQADSAFGQLSQLLKSADGPPSALFLIGDQIYADATAGIFDPKTRRERFCEAYREAWTAPNAREVLRQLPVYMMMDDHEAGDDWHPDDVLNEEERRLRDAGLETFGRYQWLHSPGYPCDPARAGGYWYNFELQGFPVFVCDTRSGRSGHDRILDQRQFDALTSWLQRQNGDHRPKIVVSPSVVVPFRKEVLRDGVVACPTRSDSWDGFPAQMVELFAFIAAKTISNVVFLCGDSHLSMATEIEFENAQGRTLFAGQKSSRPLRARCIMASPMYGPYPFVNPIPDEFAGEASLKLPGVGTMRYRVKWHTNRSGFILVTVNSDPMRGEDGGIVTRFVPADGSPPEPPAPAPEPAEPPRRLVTT